MNLNFEIMKKALFITIILISLSHQLNAQISLNTEYFGKSYYLDEDTEEKLGKGSAIIYQADINVPLYQRLNERNQPTSWGINLSGAYANMNNKNFKDDLVLDEIMNLYIGISHMRPISNKWCVLISAGAGVYSPTTRFSRINSKNILGGGGIVFVCDVNKNLKLGGGLAINNSFGFPMAFPAVYVNWTTGGRFDANVSLMDGLQSSFGYSFSKYYTLSVILDMNGQMALLEKDGKNKMFSHQYLVTGLRNEFNISDKISIPITGGINMLRMSEYSDRSLKAMFKSAESGYFDVSLYISAGLNIKF